MDFRNYENPVMSFLDSKIWLKKTRKVLFFDFWLPVKLPYFKQCLWFSSMYCISEPLLSECFISVNSYQQVIFAEKKWIFSKVLTLNTHQTAKLWAILLKSLFLYLTNLQHIWKFQLDLIVSAETKW